MTNCRGFEGVVRGEGNPKQGLLSRNVLSYIAVPKDFNGLKIPRGQPHVGSIPTLGILLVWDWELGWGIRIPIPDSD